MYDNSVKIDARVSGALYAVVMSASGRNENYYDDATKWILVLII